MPSLAIEARLLLAAEQRYEEAKGALEEADRKREKQRARCRRYLTSGKPKTVDGIQIGYTKCVSGKSFRLAQYLRRHKITAAMKPFIGDGTPYDRWVVKRVEDDDMGMGV